jgi:hypothetical protein
MVRALLACLCVCLLVVFVPLFAPPSARLHQPANNTLTPNQRPPNQKRKPKKTGFHAVAANEFGGVLLPCAAGGPPSGDAMGAWVGQSLPNTSNEQRKQLGALFARYAQQGACVFDPAPTLEHFDIARPFWANAGILFGYIAALHVLTYLAMIFTARRERR